MQNIPLSAEESLRIKDLVAAIIKSTNANNANHAELISRLTIAVQGIKIGINAAQHKEA